jgi:transposase
MAKRYVNVDRETPMLLAVDMREWVSKDDMVHLLLDAVEGVELGSFAENARGTGSEQYPPRMMLALLIYCYAMGIYSSRKIERATYSLVSVRYITADQHPDHDTIAAFRRRHVDVIESAFVQVLQVAKELNVPKMGTVCIDGTKLEANASKRSTLTEQQLRGEVQERIAQAEKVDAEQGPADTLPSELSERKTRRAKLEAARAEIKRRAEAKDREPKDSDDGNTTDPQSRIMPTAQGPYIQGYNAQLAVCAENGLIVATNVCTETNDRGQLSATALAIPQEIGAVHIIVADAGYDNSTQVQQVQRELNATVYVPVPQPGLGKARQSAARAQITAERTERAKRVESEYGQKLLKLRRMIVEPVIGTLKYNWNFRRFRMRGLALVKAEWRLLCTAYNLAKISRWMQNRTA